MQIFVCGMHRSGTSVVARLLNMVGAYFAPEGAALAANDDNPKGFWERADVVALNDRILAEAGARWFDPYPWVSRDAATPPSAELAAKLRACLLELDGHRPWFIKDPRLCLTLGSWLPLCEFPVAVICSRDEDAVVASLVDHGTSLGFRFRHEEAEALWNVYHRSLLRVTAGMTRVFVRYEEALAAPMRVVERLHAELGEAGVVGLRLPDRREVEAFIDPRLQRHGSHSGASRGGAAALERAANDDPAAIAPETLHRLAQLNRRIHDLERAAASGLRDPAAIAAIQQRIDAAPAPDGEWSASGLRTLLARFSDGA